MENKKLTPQEVDAIIEKAKAKIKASMYKTIKLVNKEQELKEKLLAEYKNIKSKNRAKNKKEKQSRKKNRRK